jgi:predicted ATP-grasp superfamily ATP-dependent carboligase
MPDGSRKVLLAASIDAVGIGRLPRLFSAAGYKVVLLGADHMAVSKSRFIVRRITCPRGAAATAPAIREHLRIHGNEYHSVVIADEPTLLAVLEINSMEWLKDWFPVPLLPHYIRRIRSKVDFLVDCREAGILTPRFEVCADEAQLRSAIESIGFPLFIKKARGLSGSGLLFARTPAELEGQSGLLTFEEPLLVQGENAGEPGSIPVLYDRGRPVCWFAYRMKLTWPNRFSSASTVAISAHRDIEDLVRDVGNLTKFNGLCGLDWMWDRSTDRIVLLEFNPRPLPTAYLGRHAGVDFSKALETAGSRNGIVQMPTGARTVIDMFPQALYYSFQQGEPRRFLRAFRDADWNDPALTAAHLRRFVTHQIPERLKTKLRRS